MNQAQAKIRAGAEAKGLRRLVAMSCSAAERVLIVREDQDLDDEFTAMDAETGELLRVKGWLWALVDDADARAELAREFWDWREPVYDHRITDAANFYAGRRCRILEVGHLGAAGEKTWLKVEIEAKCTGLTTWLRGEHVAKA